jgi:branched-chain amino acid transport system permease protein
VSTLRERVAPSAVLVALLFVVLGLYPLTAPSNYMLGFLLILFMYAALASAWNILGGFAGYLSFGHVAFFGLGAYTTALLLFYLGWSPFLTAVLGGLVGGLFALLVGYPTLRLRGPYFSLVTLVLALAVHIVILNAPMTQGAQGMFLPFPRVSVSTNQVIFYEAMLLMMALSVFTLRGVGKSKLGLGLAAVREDEQAAQTLGVNTTQLKLRAFVLSAFLTGMVGGIYAYYRSYLHPSFVFDTLISINIVLMALFGGRLSWAGPLLGAVLLSVINEFLTIRVEAYIARIVFGLLLMVVILFLPNGLMSYIRPAGLRVLQRRAAPRWRRGVREGEHPTR